jgi:hypothetical protein
LAEKLEQWQKCGSHLGIETFERNPNPFQTLVLHDLMCCGAVLRQLWSTLDDALTLSEKHRFVSCWVGQEVVEQYIYIYKHILHTYVSLITWQHGSRNFPATLVCSVQVIEGRTETLKDQLFNKAESNNVPWAQTSRVTSGPLQRGHLEGIQLRWDIWGCVIGI